jgi:hypothetical protein
MTNTQKEARRVRTAHGFQFGAADVSCAADLGGGRVAIRITTPRAGKPLDIIVTKTGKMRVFFGDFEVLVTR